MRANRFGIQVVALRALRHRAVVDRHHGVGLELHVVEDQLVLAVSAGHVDLQVIKIGIN